MPDPINKVYTIKKKDGTEVTFEIPEVTPVKKPEVPISNLPKEVPKPKKKKRTWSEFGSQYVTNFGDTVVNSAAKEIGTKYIPHIGATVVTAGMLAAKAYLLSAGVGGDDVNDAVDPETESWLEAYGL